MSQEAKSIMVECLAKLETEPEHILEILGEGLKQRLSQYVGIRRNLQYSDVLQLKNMVRDLQSTKDSLDFIKASFDGSQNLNELVYEETDTQERDRNYDTEC